jgi:hypothetical protein
MAAEYKQLNDSLTGTISETILRVADNAYIPPDPANRDRQQYEAWLAEGNEPDPPDPLPEPTPPPPDPNVRLDTGVDAAASTYNEMTPPPAAAQQPGGTGGMSVEERLLRLEESLKALCEGHMAYPGGPGLKFRGN